MREEAKVEPSSGTFRPSTRPLAVPQKNSTLASGMSGVAGFWNLPLKLIVVVSGRPKVLAAAGTTVVMGGVS